MKIGNVWIYLLTAVLLAMLVAACGVEDEAGDVRYVEDGAALDALIGDSSDEKDCKGPNPAGCSATGCDDDQKCVIDPSTCEPSACGCSDGVWICTADCAGGGVCEPKKPVCTTPNPAGCTQDGCATGETCVVDPDTCEPSHCECAGDDVWGCTRDCGGGGVCEPYDPCAGQRCGAPCSICPPDDPDCIETAVIKACNAAGECVPDTGNLCASRD